MPFLLWWTGFFGNISENNKSKQAKKPSFLQLLMLSILSQQRDHKVTARVWAAGMVSVNFVPTLKHSLQQIHKKRFNNGWAFTVKIAKLPHCRAGRHTKNFNYSLLSQVYLAMTFCPVFQYYCFDEISLFLSIFSTHYRIKIEYLFIYLKNLWSFGEKQRNTPVLVCSHETDS